MSSVSELQKAIDSYQTLIHNYEVVRSHLLERRRNATDHVMLELDDRLKANNRTIDALRRAVDVSSEHIELLKRTAAAAPEHESSRKIG